MNIPPPIFPVQPVKQKPKGCLTCLMIFGAGVICLACLIFLVPVLLRATGVFGRSAQYVYQQAPDLVAGQHLSEILDERAIEGVSIYVIPIKDTDEKGAFIILDSSKGYSGLSPMEDDDEVFFDLLRDLVNRNEAENLRIAHLTVEYRDEQGVPFVAFTVDQEVVEKYVAGSITSDEFYGSVNFNTIETLRNLGLDVLLNEEQP